MVFVVLFDVWMNWSQQLNPLQHNSEKMSVKYPIPSPYDAFCAVQ